MDNLKEFEELIEKYNSITMSDILNTCDTRMVVAAKRLTGFGRMSSCSLCMALGETTFYVDCDECTWVCKTGDTCDGANNNDADNDKTYSRIYEAQDPEELLEAFKKRAEYMKTILKIKT